MDDNDFCGDVSFCDCRRNHEKTKTIKVESSRSPRCSKADKLLKKIRDDLDVRAEMDRQAPWNPEGEKIINMSNGLWIELNDYLER